MSDVLPRHHGGDGGDESPRNPPIVPDDCESAPPPKRRQHSKSLTVYQLINKLGGCIPIQFDLERDTFYAIFQYSEHNIRHIGSLIRQQIPPYYPVLEECTRGATSSSPLIS